MEVMRTPECQGRAACWRLGLHGSSCSVLEAPGGGAEDSADTTEILLGSSNMRMRTVAPGWALYCDLCGRCRMDESHFLTFIVSITFSYRR